MTELEIVYEILEILKEVDPDSPVGERFVRNLILKHRNSKLSKFSRDGVLIPDEVFQPLGKIYFELKTPKKNKEVCKKDLPKILRLKNNFGIILSKDGYNISIQNSEEYDLSKNNLYNKFLPRAKFLDGELILFVGNNNNSCIEEDSITYHTVDKLNSEFRNYDNLIRDRIVQCDIWAVLANPEDQPSYNWEHDQYPIPSEMISEVVHSVLTVDFNIYLQTKKDDVINAKDDKINFDDEKGIR